MHPGKEERESRGDASLTEDENSVSFALFIISFWCLNYTASRGVKSTLYSSKTTVTLPRLYLSTSEST